MPEAHDTEHAVIGKGVTPLLSAEVMVIFYNAMSGTVMTVLYCHQNTELCERVQWAAYLPNECSYTNSVLFNSDSQIPVYPS